eukprot:scaffold1564_cov389-Prasinococcus_capsulatus_cf.AAC.1
MATSKQSLPPVFEQQESSFHNAGGERRHDGTRGNASDSAYVWRRAYYSSGSPCCILSHAAGRSSCSPLASSGELSISISPTMGLERGPPSSRRRRSCQPIAGGTSGARPPPPPRARSPRRVRSSRRRSAPGALRRGTPTISWQ